MDLQEIIDFLNTYIKAHGCTEMNKWVEFLEQLGWHPASELPIIPKGEIQSVELPVYCKQANTLVLRSAVYYANGHWSELNVKWWSYPPEED